MFRLLQEQKFVWTKPLCKLYDASIFWTIYVHLMYLQVEHVTLNAMKEVEQYKL